jgi:hypothetical protein
LSFGVVELECRIERFGEQPGHIATHTPLTAARPFEMPDGHATHAVRGPIDHRIQIGADVSDHGHRRVEQVDLNAAELVFAAARAVLVAEAHDDALDAVAVARQPEPQPAPDMVHQRRRDPQVQALDVDVHAFPL